MSTSIADETAERERMSFPNNDQEKVTQTSNQLTNELLYCSLIAELSDYSLVSKSDDAQQNVKTQFDLRLPSLFLGSGPFEKEKKTSAALTSNVRFFARTTKRRETRESLNKERIQGLRFFAF